ncbi:hypothetical protein [Hydrogenobacter thermophilus]|uniref:hypothetical protein n=1 Tax=Hydrogenobacter thermophilus TaxID=940 RepID=UPI0030FC3569
MTYHTLPFSFFTHIDYSVPHPSPIPVSKGCTFAINVKTVFNAPLGNPKKLAQAMKEKGIEASLDLKTKGVSYEDFPLLVRLSYLVFEFLPKSLVLKEPADMYSLYSADECLPFFSDMPIIASFMSYDFPSYSFILGRRRNLLQDTPCSDINPLNVYRAIPLSDKVKLSAYVYSESGYFFPGERLKGSGRYVIRMSTDRVLVLLSKNKSLMAVYDQNHINERLVEKGSYTVKIYTYKFKIGTAYFGLRFLACLPPVVVE